MSSEDKTKPIVNTLTTGEVAELFGKMDKDKVVLVVEQTISRGNCTIREVSFSVEKPILMNSMGFPTNKINNSGMHGVFGSKS